MNDLFRLENELLDDWAAQCDGFIRDGIINVDAFLTAKIKILYLLKEVNGGRDWDLREFVRNGGRKQTWDNIARWTKGLLHIDEEIAWNDLEVLTVEERKSIVQSICVVNVRKISGGHSSNLIEISKAASENAKALIKQIDLYSPDIVICCGTSDNYCKNIYRIKPEWKMTTRGVWYFTEPSGRIVISYSHPEARVKDCLLYYGLIDAVREILA